MSGRLENSKARNIRLVGLDLDGTVFTDEKIITPATKDAIARAVRAGVAVLPVTGRPRSGLPEEVLAIPGVRYAITSNGAMCEDLAEGSVLVRLAMDEETALRALHIAEKYDVVILDPPAFTKSRSSVKNAVKGYREINLRGMKLVKDGGFLATCSCSHFMEYELFTKTIGQAARSAHKRLRQVEYRTQAPDHPILWSSDESYYLKFYIFQVCDEK